LKIERRIALNCSIPWACLIKNRDHVSFYFIIAREISVFTGHYSCLTKRYKDD
jgi:hypothetical protein